MKIARISTIIISSILLASCSGDTFQKKFDSVFTPEEKNVQKAEQETVTADKNVQDKEPLEKESSITTSSQKPTSIKSNELKGNLPQRSEETQQRLVSQAKKLVTNGSLPKFKAHSRIAVPVVKNINGEDVVQLDYEQIEIRQILEELADALGMSIVIDPSINGKITMRTSPNQPLKHKDLWPVLNMLLNESGITLEKKAGLYYAKKSQLFLPQEVGYPSILSDPNVSVALQITPLKYISAQNALTVLKPIIGSKSKISQLSQLNMLALIGSAEQLSRINGLLSLIDVDPFKHRGIRLYKIKDAEAKEVARELKDVLKLIEGDKAAYEVLGIERINALLVVAPPLRGFKAVDRWVDILDEGADEGLQEQIFIYHCKSIKCDTLASTLNSIFDKPDTSQKKNNSKEDKSNAPNVFRTVPKDELRVASQKQSKDKKTSKTKTTSKTENKSNTVNENASANINVTIVSDEDTNTLIVRTTGKDYRHLLETIKSLDQIPLQVLVNVVIAQVTLSNDQELGVNWTYATDDAAANLLATAGINLGTEIVSNTGLSAIRTTNNFYGKISAKDTDQDIHILSRPSLLITNNQEGKINVGKEVPVETGTTTNLDSTSTVTNQVSYRKTGIEMTMTPHINDDGIIHLEITQSLSAVEGSTSTAGDSTLQPTFTNQEITTTAIMEDGETIILGGLIENTNSKTDEGIPFLKDIPVAGNLFKTTTDESERRELLLVITPKIIGTGKDLDSINNEFKARFNSVAKYLDKEIGLAY